MHEAGTYPQNAIALPPSAYTLLAKRAFTSSPPLVGQRPVCISVHLSRDEHYCQCHDPTAGQRKENTSAVQGLGALITSSIYINAKEIRQSASPSALSSSASLLTLAPSKGK
jgi:hypothetical protein